MATVPHVLCHSFWYIRGNTETVSLRLLKRGDEHVVSHAGRRFHGNWEYNWDVVSQQGVFVVHFNAGPNKPVKYHRFVQVDQTNVYRHIAPTAEWSVVVIKVEDGA